MNLALLCLVALLTLRPSEGQGNSLADGRFQTTIDVSAWLALADDAADMRESESQDEKKDIYENGRHAVFTAADGTEEKITFASLSLDAYPPMAQDPLYNIFRYAFMKIGSEEEGEDLGKFDGKPVNEYGNTLVNDLFALNIPHIEAEAAIAVSLWMAAVHELYEIGRACQDGNTKLMNESLDRAAAMWVGKDQPEGSADAGNLLYNLAQKAGREFNQANGEADANRKVLDAMNDMQQLIASGACDDTSVDDGYIDVRTLQNQLIGYMTIPLVQTLIHHIQNELEARGPDFVELYTLSIAPRIGACNPTLYKRMLDMMVFNTLTEGNREEALNAVQASLSCLHVSCADIGSYQSGAVPECNDDDMVPATLAGYTPTTNVRQYSFLDRDLMQIRILARTRAYDAALDYYQYGYNGRLDENTYLSLWDLATTPDRQVVDQFTLYTNFFESDNYADEMLVNVLDPTVAPYNSASDGQKEELAAGVLTDLVMYMAVLQKLYDATQTCNGDNSANRQDSVGLLDQAVAYYVGSMEGSEAGGREGGQLLYATSKNLCSTFSTCAEGIDSETNVKMMSTFNTLRDLLQQGDCAGAESTVNDDVLPVMPVPLFQGTLHYAVVNAALQQGTTAGSLGTGDPFANSIAPLIFPQSSVDVDVIISNMQFQLDRQPVSNDGPNDVFNAIRSALAALPTACIDVGTYAEPYGSLCGDATVPPPVPPPNPPSNPDVLGFGRYIFTTPTDIASIAYDVRDLREAADSDGAKDVYDNGGGTQITASDGTVTTVTLASMSLDAENTMAQDPHFNIARFALASETEFGDGSFVAASTYADVAVQKALDVAVDNDLAAEATIILHVWSQIAHYLYEATRVCEDGGSTTIDNIDKAFAMWLGLDQTESSDVTGYLLYSVAEKASTRYGNSENSEAKSNTDLFDLFNEAKTTSEKCASQQNAFLDLRNTVGDILRTMATPLVQNLIYYMNQAKLESQDYYAMENYVELYALALVPSLIGCSPTTFFNLQDKLIDNDFNTTGIDDALIRDMRVLQRCVRVSCSDLTPDRIGDSELKSLVKKMCYDDNRKPSIVGYSPATDVSEYSRFDMDIVQIGILVQTEAADAAIELYMSGFNNRQGKKAQSLQSLVLSLDADSVPDQFSMFSEYYGGDDYADRMIMAALRKQDEFADATVAQRREAAIRLLQSAVSYMVVLKHAYAAVDECKSDNDGTAEWDKAVAFLVGSIEGEDRGGDENGYGELIYSLGKEFCQDFGTCEGSGDASVNEALIETFTNGLKLLQDRSCDSVARLIDTELLQVLPIPLVQGTLYFSTIEEDLSAGSPDEDLATGYALSRSILPLVDNASPDDADTIDVDMDFQLTDDPVPNGAEAVFDAISFALPGMGVDCQRIGSFDDLTVCNGDLAVHPNNPTTMSDGLYTTTTYVQDRADIAKDVVAVKNALESGNVDLAELLYKDGENSALFDSNGVQTGTRSLAGFSLDAPNTMADEPLYNLFRYALQDDQGMFLGQEAGLYADSLVKEAFANTNEASKTLAAEAAVVYNVWMYLVHELYQTLANCKNKAIADTDGVHSIDEAVAYWIGDGQLTGDPEQGHLLYALAEQMGERFGLDETGQSRTNVNILRLFNQARLELSLPDSCSDNPNTFPRLWQVVNRIVSWMTVPLVQGLIHSMRENDKDRVMLYSRAFVPLIVGCSESTYSYLSEKLYSASYNVVEVDEIIAKLESAYDCLGISCGDIGVHESQTTMTCTDTPVPQSLAGYVPQSDVQAFAMLDLDILQSKILMKMGAYGAVDNLYTYGKHAVVEDSTGSQTVSLFQLATTSQRSVVPQFDSFSRYYENDVYADVFIRQALDPAQLELASPEQREKIVTKSMRFLVRYMAALQEMYQSIADCNTPDSVKLLDAEEAWDRAAAYLIGYAEGPNSGGSSEGLSFYGLAKKRCEQFGTCTETGDAQVNERLMSLIYTGRGSVEGRACGELRKAVNEIESLMMVPLIQSTLHAAVKNKDLGMFTKDEGLAEGFVYSRSVLPLVQDANRDAEETLNRNMDFQFVTRPVEDGPGAVFNAFAQAYPRMGVDCTMVGSADSIDACEGATYESGNDNVGLIVGVTVGSIAAIAIVALIYFHNKKKRKEAEAQPIFTPSSKGVMSHTSDRMTGDAYVRDEDLEDVPMDSTTEEDMRLDDSQGNSLDTDSQDFSLDIT